METRRIWRLLGGAAIALLLAGCFKVNMDLEVAADNTVSGTAVIAVEESLLELSGQNVDDLFADMDLSDLPAGSTSERYEEDGFVGPEDHVRVRASHRVRRERGPVRRGDGRRPEHRAGG